MLRTLSIAGSPALFCLSLGVLFAAAGCEPELRDEDLGQIEYRLPDSEEFGGGYELPDLSPPADSQSDEESSPPESTENAEKPVSEPAGD